MTGCWVLVVLSGGECWRSCVRGYKSLGFSTPHSTPTLKLPLQPLPLCLHHHHCHPSLPITTTTNTHNAKSIHSTCQHRCASLRTARLAQARPTPCLETPTTGASFQGRWGRCVWGQVCPSLCVLCARCVSVGCMLCVWETIPASCDATQLVLAS